MVDFMLEDSCVNPSESFADYFSRRILILNLYSFSTPNITKILFYTEASFFKQFFLLWKKLNNRIDDYFDLS